MINLGEKSVKCRFDASRAALGCFAADTGVNDLMFVPLLF